ncbi:hypothetical protein [Stutzerimonas frequens]|uniref:hypothetical protein n=1 Tax=Stutzerimonas frequens TaxID=2968969 RepID=UPI0013A6085E|nr:hypothetical protein [Stutzerimonas frequens]
MHLTKVIGAKHSKVIFRVIVAFCPFLDVMNDDWKIRVSANAATPPDSKEVF